MNTPAYLAELSMDGQCLLLPYQQVRLVESVLDLYPDPERPPGQWIRSDLGDLPVWSLDRHLQPLPTLPQERRFCVLLGVDDLLFGLSTRQFQLVSTEDCHWHPLPAALALADSPLTALVVRGERILALSDARLLAQRLGLLETTP